jgi:hypothetical protein
LLRKEDMFKRMNGRYLKAKVRPKQAKKAQSGNRGIPVKYKSGKGHPCTALEPLYRPYGP